MVHYQPPKLSCFKLLQNPRIEYILTTCNILNTLFSYSFVEKYLLTTLGIYILVRGRENK